jgi:hypothetical protein
VTRAAIPFEHDSGIQFPLWQCGMAIIHHWESRKVLCYEEHDLGMWISLRQYGMTDGIINGKRSANGPCIKVTHMALSIYTTDATQGSAAKGCNRYCKYNLK